MLGSRYGMVDFSAIAMTMSSIEADHNSDVAEPRVSPQHCSVAPVWDIAWGSPPALGVH